MPERVIYKMGETLGGGRRRNKTAESTVKLMGSTYCKMLDDNTILKKEDHFIIKGNFIFGEISFWTH